MIRISLDTSILIAGLVAPHPNHHRAMPWLAAAREHRFAGSVSTHTLAETWAVLTRLPVDPPISPPAATLATDRLASFLELVELSADDYRAAIRRCTERGLRSGMLFDALHLIAAESVAADVLLTFNARDFERLTVAAGPRVLVPPDPPRVSWTPDS